MKCIECDTVFEPKRKTAQFCSPYCRVKYNRKKLAEDGDPSVEYESDSGGPAVSGAEALAQGLGIPVEAVKPVSHVVALKQKVKGRILAKAGNPEGSSSASGGELPPVPDAFRAGVVKIMGHVQDFVDEGVVSQKTVDSAIKMVLGTFTPHPVENHGSTNDLARQMILQVKPPVVSDLSKTQLKSTKKSES